MKITILEKYYVDEAKTNYQGTHFFMLEQGSFRFYWFTDCGEWFIYVYFRKKFIRLMTGFDFLKGKIK